MHLLYAKYLCKVFTGSLFYCLSSVWLIQNQGKSTVLKIIFLKKTSCKYLFYAMNILLQWFLLHSRILSHWAIYSSTWRLSSYLSKLTNGKLFPNTVLFVRYWEQIGTSVFQSLFLPLRTLAVRFKHCFQADEVIPSVLPACGCTSVKLDGNYAKFPFLREVLKWYCL